MGEVVNIKRKFWAQEVFVSGGYPFIVEESLGTESFQLLAIFNGRSSK